mgnify:CR=1 FL=1|tara:strand:- start:792 stop:1478 length:687 start_codon:yes stop_codon:yes gene_type:complete
MDIRIKTNLKDLQKKMNIVQNKVFIKSMSEGINKTAELVAKANNDKLKQKLNKPLKTSVNAVAVTKYAKPTKRDLSAQIMVKDYAAKFLYYIYTGEDEHARRQGYPSPTRDGLPLAGVTGNIQKLKGGQRSNSKGTGLLARIDKTATSNRAGSRFMGKPKGKGSGTYGIWQRTGRKGRDGLKLLVAFTPFIKHKKLIDFFKLSTKVVKNNLYKEINKQAIKRVKRALS